MFKNPCVLDVETTGAVKDANGFTTKGNPFCPDNVMVAVGLYFKNRTYVLPIEYGGKPFGSVLAEIKKILDQADVIIGHNIKFDLNWMIRYGFGDTLSNKKLWDTGVFEYITSRQKMTSPSLNECLAKYKLPQKLDRVKSDYWDQGIDTDKIPWPILEEYTASDVKLEYWLATIQMTDLKKLPVDMQRLIRLHMEDIHFMQEVEWNGLKIDFDKCKKFAKELDATINGIDADIRRLVGSDCCNINSGDHRSAFLYGGSFEVDDWENYIFTYKNGDIKEKTRKIKRTIKMPRLINPLPKTELKKEGYFSTDTSVLTKLSWIAKGKAKKVINLLLERTSHSHLNKTYFKGFQKIYDSMKWTDNIVHGNMNQTITATGRPSSSKPNKQNMSHAFRECVISRF